MTYNLSHRSAASGCAAALLLGVIGGCTQPTHLGETAATVLDYNGLNNNGLNNNGLNNNGLNNNGLNNNGLNNNGLNNNGLNNNGLFAQWFNTNPDANGAVMTELVRCASTPDQTVTFTDAYGRQHSWTGALGLAPEFYSRAMTQTNKQLVEGCLFAKVNARGKHVYGLSFRLEGPSVANYPYMAVSACEASVNDTYVGTFFSNAGDGYGLTDFAAYLAGIGSSYGTLTLLGPVLAALGRDCSEDCCGVGSTGSGNTCTIRSALSPFPTDLDGVQVDGGISIYFPKFDDPQNGSPAMRTSRDHDTGIDFIPGTAWSAYQSSTTYSFVYDSACTGSPVTAMVLMRNRSSSDASILATVGGTTRNITVPANSSWSLYAVGSATIAAASDGNYVGVPSGNGGGALITLSSPPPGQAAPDTAIALNHL